MTYRGSIKNKFGSNRNYQSIALAVSGLNYYGDLSPAPKMISTDVGLTKPGFSISYESRVAPRYSVRGNFLYGTRSGADRESADQSDLTNGVFRFNRNLSFRNRISELSAMVVVDLFKNASFYTDRVRFAPYIFFGAGLLHHNPQAKVPLKDLQGNELQNAGEWVDLKALGTEGQNANLTQGDANYGIKPYNLIQPVIPVGMGVRIRLNDQCDISWEISVRYLFSDYIDDVSRNYVDLGVLGDNELAKAMSYRTNEIMTPNYQYTSERDGQQYSVLAGYGHEREDSKRGNMYNNDLYSVVSIRLSYIVKNLPSNRAKSR